MGSLDLRKSLGKIEDGSLFRILRNRGVLYRYHNQTHARIQQTMANHFQSNAGHTRRSACSALHSSTCVLGSLRYHGHRNSQIKALTLEQKTFHKYKFRWRPRFIYIHSNFLPTSFNVFTWWMLYFVRNFAKRGIIPGSMLPMLRELKFPLPVRPPTRPTKPFMVPPGGKCGMVCGLVRHHCHCCAAGIGHVLAGTTCAWRLPGQHGP